MKSNLWLEILNPADTDSTLEPTQNCVTVFLLDFSSITFAVSGVSEGGGWVKSPVLLGAPFGLMGPGWGGDGHSMICWVVCSPTLSGGPWPELWLDLYHQCDRVTMAV